MQTKRPIRWTWEGAAWALGSGVKSKQEFLFLCALHCLLLYRPFSNIITTAILQAGSPERILGVFFFIITQIHSQALHQPLAAQQFNSATPPLLLLVTLKYANPLTVTRRWVWPLHFSKVPQKSLRFTFWLHLSIPVLVPAPWGSHHPSTGRVALSFRG